MELTKVGGTLELNLDELFEQESQEPQEVEGAGTPPAKSELTDNMIKRINDVRAKTEITVKEQIAKDLGFESFEAMQKANEHKAFTEAGYNPEDIEKLIGPVVEKRLSEDPRMQELASFRAREEQRYVANQLAEIEKLTGLKVAEKDLSPETIELWKKGVDLSKAYIATNTTKINTGFKPSTTHLATGAGAGGTNLRSLTQAEKDLYRSINPDITEEELNKKTLEVK